MTPEEELQQKLRDANEGDTTPGNDTVNVTPPVKATTPPVTGGPSPKQSPEFWGDSEIKRETPKPTPEPGSPEAKTGAGKITKQAIDMGARTAVSTINLAQVTLMRPILNWRFKKESEKRFGENLDRAQEMVMGEITPTDPKEKTLKTRFQKFLEQRDKKLIDLPFTDREEGDLEYAFKTYFEVKQVAMSPEVLLYCSLGSIMGKRAIDAFMWD